MDLDLILRKKIGDRRVWRTHRVIGYEIDGTYITLTTNTGLEIRINWDGETLDFLDNTK